MEKIGIMGGTFNPIHTAHLILAESSYEQLNLNKVLFMPSKNPPHKLHDNIAGENHRIQMVQLAIKDNPHFELSTIELERDGLTFTAETLEYLTSHYPDNEYYFIIGADSLFQIELWRYPEKILRLSHIIAAGRDNIPKEDMEKQIQYLEKKFNGMIHYLQVPNMDISSKNIRSNVKQRKSIRYFVPDVVEQYISEHHLYEEN